MMRRRRASMLGVALIVITLGALSITGAASAAAPSQAIPRAAAQASGLHCTYTAVFNKNDVRVFKGTASSGPDFGTVIGKGYIGQSVTHHTSNGSGIYTFITYVGDDHKARDDWVSSEDVDVTPHCIG